MLMRRREWSGLTGTLRDGQEVQCSMWQKWASFLRTGQFSSMWMKYGIWIKWNWSIPQFSMETQGAYLNDLGYAPSYEK